MKNAIFSATLILLILTSGCEKAIHIVIPGSASQLVVEGYIYSGLPPVVILSHSLGFFSKISSSLIDSSFVHGATITVSNGIQTQTLKEYALDTTGGNTIYFYSADSSRPLQIFTGVPGNTYSLHIITGGTSYTASTSIPKGGDILDSLWVIYPPLKADSGKAILMGSITDPPQPGNCIRYFTRINSGPFLPGFNSVFNDDLTNGTTYSTEIAPGFDKNNITDSAHRFFQVGDTVTVELSNIDQATYNFWHTYDYSFTNTGNPFSSPILILGNVPGALGYWGGYEQQYKTIIIP
ncbi:MAG TPA: DUF4249 family protein [Chitinophagaceae bacterium]|nr:DUF4249 family protein [Chitinophagaceae bacterium]